ncbi:hypothetical protein DPMN_084783 [Dreissena polymorpha]|uniref:Uncharacterized protein n=1 Tax=Dreissena polymorpha TaxID=45954 RepID=A0A9D3YB67_DREPO|nr:hypothetical protein DPMN_084783 [Dreissena polymorpha]
MFNDVSKLSPTVALIAPLFAKSTSVWNPLIYAVRNRETNKKTDRRTVSSRACEGRDGRLAGRVTDIQAYSHPPILTDRHSGSRTGFVTKLY